MSYGSIVLLLLVGAALGIVGFLVLARWQTRYGIKVPLNHIRPAMEHFVKLGKRDDFIMFRTTGDRFIQFMKSVNEAGEGEIFLSMPLVLHLEPYLDRIIAIVKQRAKYIEERFESIHDTTINFRPDKGQQGCMFIHGSFGDDFKSRSKDIGFMCKELTWSSGGA